VLLAEVRGASLRGSDSRTRVRARRPWRHVGGVRVRVCVGGCLAAGWAHSTPVVHAALLAGARPHRCRRSASCCWRWVPRAAGARSA
jgi:hypothetical protein